MHANLNIYGNTVMLSDVFPGMTYKLVNNISPEIIINNKEKIKTIFNKLSKSGIIEIPLQETECSVYYGSVINKFGISWQFNQQNNNYYIL